ncbi:MAG TPA: ribonuclease HII [Candidatus Lokiarchaeia archaeon]|nr:ribonuclease HII [Candidatus Lokiarchaeia archaeon]
MDEAGRGPVLGPMVICGLAVEEEQLRTFAEIGVKDSKLLTPKKRELLAGEIRKITSSIVVREISAADIDAQRAEISLNEIEVRAMGAILAELHPDVIYIDAVDVNEERFGLNVLKYSELTDVEVIAEHKADFNYPVVGAASIIAKTTRDAEIRKLKENYGEIGSGYTSDEKTIRFLEAWVAENKDLPPFARRSWKTAQNILNAQIKQKKITDF